MLVATLAGVFARGRDGWLPLGPAPLTTAVSADGSLVLAADSRGIHVSRDAGHSWRLALQSSAATAVVAAGPVLLAASAEDGVQRSQDAGESWATANAGLLDLEVLALAASPRCAENGFALAGTASGLFLSRNAGRSWRSVDLDPDETVVQALAISPFPDSAATALAGTTAHGLFMTRDAGASWMPLSGIEGSVSAVAIGDGGMAAAAAGTVWLSKDGGSWRTTADPGAPVLALAYTASGLVAGLAGLGIAVLDADGVTWRPDPSLAASLTTRLRWSGGWTLALGPDGAIGVSEDAGRSWSTHATANAGTARDLVRWPADGPIWLLAETGLMRSIDRGRGWEQRGTGGSALASSTALWSAGTNGSLRSTADGLTWIEHPACPGGTIEHLAMAPDESPLAATADGLWLLEGSLWEQVLDGPVSLVASGRSHHLAAVGTTVLIGRHDEEGWQVAELGHGIGSIRALLAEPIVVGTAIGAVRSPDQGRRFLAPDADGPPSVMALAALPGGEILAADATGTLWRWRQ
ncbi:MAG TPA: hypothetical protein PKA13_06765 [Geminicoccaceae bacterium]|nr:hypothetical protein [Geminicoccaceae bacterium]